ncbi:MAG: type II CAAX endopeptidase family protein [Actinomycetes bacterium]
MSAIAPNSKPSSGTNNSPSVRWGLGDAIWVWLAALAVTLFAGAAFAALRRALGLDGAALGGAGGSGSSGDSLTDIWDLVFSSLIQNATIIGFIIVVSHLKGVGSLRRDFGLRLLMRDWWWLPAGAVISAGSAILLEPILHFMGKPPTQAVVTIIDKSSGIGALAAALSVAIAAPIAEELLFRGLVLRSLQRRYRPGIAIAITAVTFAAVHPLLDPKAILALVPLLILSVVSGIQAARSGNLSRSIWLHMGFNAITAVGLLLN